MDTILNTIEKSRTLRYGIVTILGMELVLIIFLISKHPRKINKIKDSQSYCIISVFMLYVSDLNLIFLLLITIFEICVLVL